MSAVLPLKGLEGIIATKSSICWIDGDEGVLSYRGIDIHQLADHSNFEETTYLLWFGVLPTVAQLAEFRKELAAARTMNWRIYDFLRSVPHDATPMEVLRTAVSLLSLYDPDEKDSSHESNVRKSYRLTSQIAMIVAIFDRIRKGRPIVDPDRTLSHSANFLRMLNGVNPTETATRALDVALILQADHELNASTFAARVIASTLSDIHSAIVGAIGALKGPLHGGANAETMKILICHRRVGRGPGGVCAADVRGEEEDLRLRPPGIHHRRPARDSPAASMSEDLGGSAGNTKWFDMSRKIELFVNEEKKLNANVDFYSASTYTTLGVEIDLFTPIFAISRIAGWTAHVIEQLDDNRLIRPRADYIGPPYPQPYTLIEKR